MELAQIDSTGPWEHRACQMLAAIRDANEAGEEPNLPVDRNDSEDYERHVQLFDDLMTERLITAEIATKSAGGDLVVLMGCRLTSAGRTRLAELEGGGDQDDLLAPLPVVEYRAVESWVRDVQAALEAERIDASADQLAQIQAQLDTITSALRAPSPVKRVVFWALRATEALLLSTGGSVVAVQLAQAVPLLG